jgi:hypothetical protein
MNLRILKDCIQVPLDEEYNEILIYYYTDSPNKPYDAFVRRRFNIPDEIPMYLYVELWKWNGKDYVRKDRNEKVLGKRETKVLINKYLKFVVPKHEWDFSYNDFYEKNKDYKHSVSENVKSGYYNLGNGGRWNRAWEKDEYDSVTMKYGALY